MKRVLIMGAAGRDFHNFNVYFRRNSDYKVVAFTATQIPDIEGRRYPAKLAGKLYPKGLPIESEGDLIELIRKHSIDLVVFSYSDVSHQYVMERASQVMAAGANFMLLGPETTQLSSTKPIISVTAVRTGAGKSQTTRRVAAILRNMAQRVVIVRHPMPYGDLVAQECQRFASYKDLDRYNCTIEEREEYEPHIANGNVVYAGVDYERILRMAERDADVIVWDGGNNDFSFYKSHLTIVVADPLRAGHETSYYPGHINLLLANVVVINKVDTAGRAEIDRVRESIRVFNPQAKIIEAVSPLFVEEPKVIENKRVLVIEDGPTLTHGEMGFGAATLAAEKFGAKEIVDPRAYAVNSIAETFKRYPHIGKLLPAMGYGKEQIRNLAKTIKRTPCEAVIIGTPIDLKRLIQFDVPATRVRYELQEIGYPTLEEIIAPLVS